MKLPDPIIDRIVDRSETQKTLRIEIMRLELKGYGLAIVSQEWLSRIPVARRMEAMAEVR